MSRERLMVVERAYFEPHPRRATVTIVGRPVEAMKARLFQARHRPKVLPSQGKEDAA